MSTNASTHTLLSEPSDDLIVSEPWSIDNYADGLMDELFADIDHILDGKGNVPVHTIEPEYERVQTVKVPPVVVKRTEQVTVSNQQLSKVRKEKTNQNAVPKTVINRKPRRRWLSKILSLGATVGVAAVALVCVHNSGLLNRLVSRSFQQSLLAPNEMATPTVEVEDVQTELVNYMLGALAAIDRQNVRLSSQSEKSAYVAVTNPQPIAMAGQGAGQLPPPMAANNTAPTNSRSTTVVERIYIPVYQAPLPMRYAPPQIPGVRGTLPPVPTQKQSQARVLPKTPSVKTALNNVGKKLNNATKPLNVFAAVRPALKPLTIARTPITVNQPKAPTINLSAFRAIPPQLPTAKPKSELPKETVRPAQPQQQRQEVAVAPTDPISHKLEGLLELGDKSAALFQVNGITRRIEIGESIGASGWTLVEVVNDKAVIRRNGEVRSIYAGQNF